MGTAEEKTRPLTSTQRGRVPVTVVVDGSGLSRPPNLVRLAIGAGLPRGSRSHRASMDATEEEILNSARRTLSVEEERRGEGAGAASTRKRREGKARGLFWRWHRCTGQIPYARVCSRPAWV